MRQIKKPFEKGRRKLLLFFPHIFSSHRNLFVIKWNHIYEDGREAQGMDDEKIIGLFWSRSENAIAAAQEKYGDLLRSVAKKITQSDSDADECLNDALLRLWSNIPPARP